MVFNDVFFGFQTVIFPFEMMVTSPDRRNRSQLASDTPGCRLRTSHCGIESKTWGLWHVKHGEYHGDTHIYIYICIGRCIHLCICTCICICLWICILHVHLYYLRGEQVNQQYRETRKPTLSPTNNAMGTPTWRIWYEDITRIAKESQFEALPPTCLKQDFVGMDNSWKGVFWCCRFCVTPGSRQFFWSTKKILQRQQHSECGNFQYDPNIEITVFDRLSTMAIASWGTSLTSPTNRLSDNSPMWNRWGSPSALHLLVHCLQYLSIWMEFPLLRWARNGPVTGHCRCRPPILGPGARQCWIMFDECWWLMVAVLQNILESSWVFIIPGEGMDIFIPHGRECHKYDSIKQGIMSTVPHVQRTSVPLDLKMNPKNPIVHHHFPKKKQLCVWYGMTSSPLGSLRKSYWPGPGLWPWQIFRCQGSILKWHDYDSMID